MKKLLFFAAILLIQSTITAQVFSTGQTLKKNTLSLGINPVFMDNGPSDGLNVYFHGGYGLKDGVDFAVKFGVGNSKYIGTDLEWALGKNFSLTTGGHMFNDFGLDVALLGTIPIRKDADLYLGIDADIVFANDVLVPIWVPVGIELGLSKNMALILEGEIAIVDDAYHIFGGGLNFYF